MSPEAVVETARLTRARFIGLTVMARCDDENEDPFQGTSWPHLAWMADCIVNGKVTGNKANRWLGWLQCAMVFKGATTLNQMKELSRQTSDEYPE